MTNIHRKVFDELATILSYLPRVETEGFCFEPSEVIREIATVLKNNCSTFDRERFLKACGVGNVFDPEWSGTRIDEQLEYGYVFDVDGNERPMTEQESKEHDEVSVEYVKQYGLANGMTQAEIDAYIARVEIQQQERILDMLDPPAKE